MCSSQHSPPISVTRVRGSNAWGDDIAWVKFVVESRHCRWRTTLGYATCKSLYIHLFFCLFIYLFMYLFVYSFPTNLYYYYARSQVWHHFQRPSKNYSKRKKSFSVIPRFNLTLFFFTFDRLVNPPWKLVLIPFFCRLLWYVFQLRRTMIIRGDKEMVMKADKYQSWKQRCCNYVGSSLTVHNPCFFVLKFWINKLIPCFYWSVSSKW